MFAGLRPTQVLIRRVERLPSCRPDQTSPAPAQFASSVAFRPGANSRLRSNAVLPANQLCWSDNRHCARHSSKSSSSHVCCSALRPSSLRPCCSADHWDPLNLVSFLADPNPCVDCGLEPSEGGADSARVSPECDEASHRGSRDLPVRAWATPTFCHCSVSIRQRPPSLQVP